MKELGAQCQAVLPIVSVPGSWWGKKRQKGEGELRYHDLHQRERATGGRQRFPPSSPPQHCPERERKMNLVALPGHSFLLTDLWGKEIKKTLSEEALAFECESEGEAPGMMHMLCPHTS